MANIFEDGFVDTSQHVYRDFSVPNTDPFGVSIFANTNSNGVPTSYSYSFNQAYAFNSAIGSGELSRASGVIEGMDDSFTVPVGEDIEFKVGLRINKQNLIIEKATFYTGEPSQEGQDESSGIYPVFAYKTEDNDKFYTGVYQICTVRDGSVITRTIRDNIYLDNIQIKQLGVTGAPSNGEGGLVHLIQESGQYDSSVPILFRGISGGSGIQLTYDSANASGGNYIVIDSSADGGGGGGSCANVGDAADVYVEGTSGPFNFRSLTGAKGDNGRLPDNEIYVVQDGNVIKFSGQGVHLSNTGYTSSSVKVYHDSPNETGPVTKSKAAFREIDSDSGSIQIGLTNSDNTISIEYPSGKYKPYYNWTGENVGVGSQIYKAGTGPAFNSKAQFRKIVGRTVTPSNTTESDQKATVTVGVGTQDDIEISVDLSTAQAAGAQESYLGQTSLPTGSFIAGGTGNSISGHYNVINAGSQNKISGGQLNFIGGGSGNDVNWSRFSSSLGGRNNDVSGADFSVVLGGNTNLITGGNAHVIGGGDNNQISGDDTKIASTIVGGTFNKILGNTYSFIGAGGTNTIYANNSVIGGGTNNIASGDSSVVFGGSNNQVLADYGLAAGRYSKVQENHDGAFVLSDSNTSETLSSGANTLTLNFKSGVYVDSDSGIYINGNPVMTGASDLDTDTLQTVTDRGATTTNAISIHNTSAGGNPRLSVGRETSQSIEIDVDDTSNTIVARQDTDSNADHKFVLNRVLAGTGRNDFQIAKAGVAQVTVDTNGNVGIGTTAPSSGFSSEAQRLVIGDGVGSEGMSIFAGTSSSSSIFFADGAAGSATYQGFVQYRHGDSRLDFGAAGGRRMVMDGNGLLIIPDGASSFSPNAELEISSSLPAIRLTDSDLTNHFSEIERAGTSLNFYSRSNASNGKFVFLGDNGTSDTEFMRIETDGDVGIGSNNPSAKLDVAGGIKLLDNNYLSWNSSNTRIVGNSSYLQFQVAASDKVRITSAGNVGIGTVTPRTSLHVSKAGNTEGGILTISNPNNTDGAYCGIEFINSTFDYPRSAIFAQRTGGAYDAELTFHTSPTNEITGTDYPAATERMRIDHDGNVGIGTNNPLTPLHVQGSPLAGYVAGDVNADTMMVIENDDNARLAIVAGSLSDVLFGDAADQDVGRIRYNHSDDAMIFFTNGSEKVRIKSGGDVGIGTNNPQELLHIDGSSPRIRLRDSDAAGTPYAHIDASDGALLIEADKGDETASSYIALTVDGSESIRAIADGNVGIGTNTPAANLQIDTPAANNAGQGLRINRPSAGTHYHAVEFSTNGTVDWSVGQNSDDSFQVYENGASATTRLTIEEGGNVGIGTTNPTETLEVTGDIFINGGPAGGRSLALKRTGATNAWKLTQGHTQTDYLEILEGSDTRFLIKNGGNVGIGTNAPSGKLDVNGVAYFEGGTTVGHIQNETDAAIILNDNDYIYSQNAGTYLRRLIGKDSAGAIHIGEPSTSIINEVKFYAGNGASTKYTFHSGTTELVRIDASGSVGIGTTSPKGKLHIEGDKSYSLGYLDATSDLHIGNDTMSSAVGAYAGSISFGSTNESNLQAASIVAIQTDTDPNEIGLAFFTQHSHFGSTDLVESMRIRNDGNVGIGTTNPISRLNIKSSATSSEDSALTITQNGGSNTIFAVGERATNGAQMLLFDGGTATHAFYTDGSNNYINAGNVGIGIAAPSGNLHIQGAAVAGYVSDTYADLITESSDSRIQVVSDNGGSNGSALILTNVDAGTHSNWAFGQTTTSQGNKLHIGHNTAAGGDVSAYTTTQDLTLTTAGDVGIGSFSPARKLDVVGDAAVSTNLIVGTALYTNQWIASSSSSQFIKNSSAATSIEITNAGNVGIGSSPTNKLDVFGHFSATSKSFLIDHPTKENKKLQYGSLEGPENGVYVRGTTDEETIELPEYWSELVHDESITVVLTPIGKKQDLFIIKKSNKLIKIGGVEGSYDYVVYGERKDIEKLEIEPLKV